jgi:hypothetical protein
MASAQGKPLPGGRLCLDVLRGLWSAYQLTEPSPTELAALLKDGGHDTIAWAGTLAKWLGEAVAVSRDGSPFGEG